MEANSSHPGRCKISFYTDGTSHLVMNIRLGNSWELTYNNPVPACQKGFGLNGANSSYYEFYED